MAGFKGKGVAVKSFVKSKCFKAEQGALARCSASVVLPCPREGWRGPSASRAPTALELLLIFVP